MNYKIGLREGLVKDKVKKCPVPGWFIQSKSNQPFVFAAFSFRHRHQMLNKSALEKECGFTKWKALKKIMTRNYKHTLLVNKNVGQTEARRFTR